MAPPEPTSVPSTSMPISFVTRNLYYPRSAIPALKGFHDVCPGGGSVRPDSLRAQRGQRLATAAHLARPVAELRRHGSVREFARDGAEVVRPRHHAFRSGEQLRAAAGVCGG